MKKIILLSVFIISCLSAFAIITPTSLQFSNSYLARSTGVEAIYWNPANLGMMKQSEMMFLASSLRMENNALNINLYNDVSGKYLDDILKDRILKAMNGSLTLDGEMQMILFGIATQNFGISVGTDFLCKAKVSDDYVRLLLKGNVYDSTYNFNIDDNSAAGVGYADVTFALGNFTIADVIPYFQNSPLNSVRLGASVSALIGIASLTTDKYSGSFYSGDNGLCIDQTANFRNSTGGFGYKGMLAMSVQPREWLNMSMTFDNLAGTINWNGKTEMNEVAIHSDSVYVAHMNDDFFTQTDTTYSVPGFTTTLPAVMSFGSMFKYKDFSYSFDIKKNLNSANVNSNATRVSMGGEYTAFGFWPLRIGMSLKNSDLPASYSVGTGLSFKYYECSLGMMFTDSINLKDTKGFCVSGAMKFRY